MSVLSRTDFNGLIQTMTDAVELPGEESVRAGSRARSQRRIGHPILPQGPMPPSLALGKLSMTSRLDSRNSPRQSLEERRQDSLELALDTLSIRAPSTRPRTGPNYREFTAASEARYSQVSHIYQPLGSARSYSASIAAAGSKSSQWTLHPQSAGVFGPSGVFSERLPSAPCGAKTSRGSAPTYLGTMSDFALLHGLICH